MDLRIIPVLVLAAVLSGCAAGYRPLGATGGYSEVQLDRNTFRVTYTGTVGADRDRIADLALLRSAEIALGYGFPFFTSSGTASTGTAVLLATNVVAVPATTITLVGYTVPPDTDAIVYDAERIVSSLGPRYR